MFFELLQVALGTRDQLSRVPSAQEWTLMLHEAERQCVAGFFLEGIERLPDEQQPPLALKLQWIGLVQMGEENYRLQCERLRVLSQRLRMAGFKNCVLKGVGLAQLYSNPAHRQCGDIDVWVDGGMKEVMAWLQSQYEVGKAVWHHVDVKIFDDLPTEIHLHPAWLYYPVKNRRLQHWFERNKDAQMVEDRKLDFAYPTVRFNAIFSLVHTFHHLMEEGVGLRYVVDYYYILQKMRVDSLECRDSGKLRNEIVDLSRRFGLYKFLSAMMWVLQAVCGMPKEDLLCKPNEKEGRFLLNEIMAGGNFGKTRQDGKQRKTFARWHMMLKHYPTEALWMLPWKVWHWGWMRLHR